MAQGGKKRADPLLETGPNQFGYPNQKKQKPQRKRKSQDPEAPIMFSGM